MSSGAVVTLLVLALVGFWALGAYNRLVRLRNAVVAAWAPIDAQLRRRQALAFELAELLAGQDEMRDEVGRLTLQTVVAATRQAQAAADHAQVRPSKAGAVQSLSLAEQVLEGALRPLRVVIGSRPALLGDPALAERLQAALQGLHEADAQLAFVRRMFNEAVLAYNGAVNEVPTRVIAGVFGFRPAAALQYASPDRGPESQLASTFGP
jgi:LemA protein